MINAAQIRAARGLLDWSREALATACGVSMPALSKIETSKSNPHPETLAKVQAALEQAGCLFTDNSGVKLKSDIVTVYEKKAGLFAFYDDLYLTALHYGGDLFISGGNQQDFYDALGNEFIIMHAARMRDLKDVKVKMIKPESRAGEPALNYIEYRVVPDQMFYTVPFYVYHDKLAIIIWEPEPRVLVINDQRVTDAYRQQFATIWKLARRIEITNYVDL